ncbi:GDYXXLXY domain-containing protein [Lutibacter sp. B2]|nr:GDYXXLXY domain-containing protein [Lutibacter sp. B2]
MKKTINKRGFKYLVSFLVLTLILLSMTIQPIMTQSFGEEILIKTKAFDPRDVFRGDYVRLNYEINDISLNKVDKEISKKIEDEYNSFKELRKKKLYVTLRKEESFYVVDKVTLKKPTEGIFLKAKYEYTLREEKEYEKIKGIRVSYTLDKYFVPENTGKELEDKIRKGEAFAKIKVYRGYSLLNEITFN